MPKPVAKTAPSTTEKVEASFADKLRLVDRAGYGVILVRTREPVRVIDAMKHYAYVRKNPETKELDTSFRVWDCSRGWVEYPVAHTYNEGALSVEEKEPKIISADTDITAALALIQDVNNLGKDAWPTSICVFNYAHAHIQDNATFTVILKSYCHTLPTGRSRVILVVPDGFSMPSELEDDITIMDFSVPTQRELQARFYALLEELGKECPYDESEVMTISSAGLGMTELDFDQSIALGIAEFSEGDTAAPIAASLEQFLSVIYRCKMEAVKRTNILSLQEPLSPSDIGGNENIKAWATARRNWLSPEAKKFGLRAPRGMLVVGVQGCAKSLIPRIIAAIFKVPCVRFDMSKVFNKYVGESETRMDMALAFIAAIAPVVVSVEEIEKMAGGTEGNNESTERVKTKLLTFMQEAPDGIFWVPSANRAEKIPPELVRPGRIDVTMGVVLPRPPAREDIIKIHLRKRKQSPTLADIQVAVEMSNGYTGSEIETAVNNAVGECFESFVAGHPIPMSGALVAKHVKFIKPQSISHADDMNRIIQWCEKNAIPADADDAKKEDRSVAPLRPGVKAPRKLG